MATEHFRILAVLETDNWDQTIIETNQFEAAFGFYLIREGERTHCCSLSASSGAEWLQNAFVYAPDNHVADAAVQDGELEHEGGNDFSYFPYVDFKTRDKRFFGDRITLTVNSREYGGLKSDAYHDAIWQAAREEATSNGGSYEPRILGHITYREWEAEQTAKRHAENVKPLAGRDQLPLFVAQAKRDGIDTYDAARNAGLI
jgi:hypothetical protein